MNDIQRTRNTLSGIEHSARRLRNSHHDEDMMRVADHIAQLAQVVRQDILDKRDAGVKVSGPPLGPTARLLGITGVLVHPVGGIATVQTTQGVSFVAPSHIALWLAQT